MKLLTTFFFVILFSLIANAQHNSESFSNKGRSTITVGYGIGNVWVYFLKHNSFFIDYVPNYTVKSMGPITGCYENFILKKISVGLAVSYSNVKGKGDSRGFFVDDQISIFTALIRGNYHFGKFPKFDPYVGGGIGYIRSAYKSYPSVSGPVPGDFGYSAQIGAHYYITKQTGVYGELGYVNGSFMQIGINVDVFK